MKRILSFIIGTTFVASASLAQVGTYSVGETVDNFTVTDTKGNQHDLYTITGQGKYVYLDFFFTTCGPCQATSPTWNEFYDKYGCNEGDVYCITVNRGESNNAAVDAFEDQYGGSFNHAPAISGDGGAQAVREAFGISQYPTYCMIGPDNKLKVADIWPISNVGTFEATFPTGFNPTPMACTAGINDELTSDFSGISVYPNPSAGQFNLNMNSTVEGNFDVKVTNISGQVVASKNISVQNGLNSINMDLSVLNAGQYIVQIIDEKNIVSPIKIQITE